MILTKEQRKAVKRIYIRSCTEANPPKFMSLNGYRNFRRKVDWGWTGVIMVPFAGMWLGVEKDGYTHS